MIPSLHVQRAISFTLFPFYSPLFLLILKFFFQIRVNNLSEVRSKYRLFLNSSPRPVLICSNHLTYIDSFILSYALSSNLSYLFSFNSHPWHLPEKTIFAKNGFLSLLTYLIKGIPVQRFLGFAKNQGALVKIQSALKSGQIISLFPEGKRGRGFRINPRDYSYAPGFFLKDEKIFSIVCLYLRNKKIDSYASFPPRKSSYDVEIELLTETPTCHGNKKIKYISSRIIKKLAEMEEKCFEREASYRR